MTKARGLYDSSHNPLALLILLYNIYSTLYIMRTVSRIKAITFNFLSLIFTLLQAHTPACSSNLTMVAVITSHFPTSPFTTTSSQEIEHDVKYKQKQ